MSSINSTVWDIEKHTIAKHKILQNYLSAWFPILSSWNKKILYIDGFAGPGIYSNGEEGSPIIAIRSALSYSILDSKEIYFLFIEKEEDRLKSLKSVIAKKFSALPFNYKIRISGGEFKEVLSSILNKIGTSERLIPTFVFIDPFGYSSFTMKIISQILKYDTTEIFVTFMSGFLKRFTRISESTHEKTLNDLFGDNGWKKANELQGTRKENFIIDYYCSKLKEIAKAKYVKHFEMRDNDDKLIYHLVFGTKHLKGLKVMKESMYKVDKLQMYKFSDATDSNQKFIIDYFHTDWMDDAGTQLLKKFRGETKCLEKIEEYILVYTPYRFLKEILIRLEKSGKIEAFNRNKKYSYPDGCKVKFL